MLCFRKSPVAKKFRDKREGEVSRFPSKVFCPTVLKNAVGEPFSLSIISGIEEVWVRVFGGGGVSVLIFREKFPVSQYRNISQRIPSVLCFRKLPVKKNSG